MPLILLIFAIIAALGIIGGAIYIAVNRKPKLDSEQKVKSVQNKNVEKSEEKVKNIPQSNFIYPKEFNAGMLISNDSVMPAMNNCDHNTLYPINALDVEYGNKAPNCRVCTEFIQPP